MVVTGRGSVDTVRARSVRRPRRYRRQRRSSWCRAVRTGATVSALRGRRGPTNRTRQATRQTRATVPVRTAWRRWRFSSSTGLKRSSRWASVWRSRSWSGLSSGSRPLPPTAVELPGLVALWSADRTVELPPTELGSPRGRVVRRGHSRSGGHVDGHGLLEQVCDLAGGCGGLWMLQDASPNGPVCPTTRAARPRTDRTEPVR